MTIYGAKKGQATPRQPVIAPDSAHSKTFINIMYGLGEGEMAGLADGYKSVYLDDTPLQNDGGEFNFAGIKVDFRAGTNDQAYIDGFADVASETAVGVELKHGTPWVKSFNNLDLDALRVRLKWGALRSQNRDNGDVGGVKIDYAIDVKTDNGGWVEMLSTAINAKTSDAYERSHRIDLPKAQTGWQLRVRRLTPNAASDFISDKMYVSAITEVIDLKLRYPNTALLGLRYDAETFSSVAKMSARCKGLIIKVPTNYDPITHTYTGLWDGTFKLAYSNNPAWVYYDLCTAERYGLGSRLTGSMIDKWSLYRLAQYCDEMVDDGMGGTEPRFTVNVYIQSADGAFELLSRLAGVFRAISYWDGNSIVLDADIPQDSMYSFSRANVIDGVFEYTGTRARDRHTVAKVAWDNPANHFKTEYEYVRDEAAIAKFGVRVVGIQAWGCTSKGQAQRAGLWALKSEQLETRMVTFKVGLDGYIPAPAKVIEISDELFAGRATGGRVLGINKAKTVITLDRTITAKAGDTLVINGDDGVSQRRQIRSVAGDKVTVTKAFGSISVEHVWVLDSQDLATMKFRVLSVTADDNHTFTITAVQYNPAKYDAIDAGAYIDERPISVIHPTIQAPTKSVNLSSYHTTNQGVSVTTLVIGWEQAAGAVKYAVEWRKDNGNWVSLPPTGTNSIEISGVYAGAYEARVTAISAFGQASTATHSALTQIAGKVGKPPRLASLTAKGVLFGMELTWTFNAGSSDTNFTEIEVSPDGRSNIATLGQFAYPTNKHEMTGLQGNLTQFYRARIVDKLGNVSDWTAWTSGTTDAQADKVLDLLAGQITTSQLHQDLSTPIGKIGTLETNLSTLGGKIPTLESSIATINGQLPTLNAQIASLQNELGSTNQSLAAAQSTLNTAVANINTERSRITAAIRDITTLQSANNAKTQEITNLTQTVGSHTSSIRELGVTTGDLVQKYSQLKTASDTASSEITAIKQTQSGQAVQLSTIKATADKAASDISTVNQALVSEREARAVAIDRLSSRFDGNLLVGHDGVTTSGYRMATLPLRRQLAQGQKVVMTIYADLGDDRTGIMATNTNGAGASLLYRFTNKNSQGIYQAVFDWNVGTGSNTAVQIWQLNQSGISQSTLHHVSIEIVDAISETTQAHMNSLRETMTSADTALSQQITALDTAYKAADRTLSANLASESTARTTADTALGQRINSLQTDYNGNKASVASQLKTLSDKDTATASQISSLTANVTTAQSTANNALSRANTANTAIATEQSTRADADTALSNRITAMDSAYKMADNQANAKLASLEQAVTNANQAIATAQSQLSARFDSLAVGGRNLILNSKQALTVPAGGAANREKQIRMGLANMDWTTVKQLTLSADVKHADDLVRAGSRWWRMALELSVSHSDGTTSYPKAMITAPVATAFNGRISYVWDIPKEIRTVNNAVMLVQNINSGHPIIIANPKLEIGNTPTDWTPAPEDVQTAIDATTASLDEFKTTQASKDTATVSQISTLQTTVNGQSASIAEHSQSINGLSAQWTIKAESNGIVSGIGLASSNGISDFAIRANKFYVVAPTGTTKTPLFSVLTTATTINGVSVPTGVYIDSAYIQNASITGVKIANGAITTAKIGDAQISNAKIANSAITTAKIGVAQVDTLQIAGEAVVVPRLQYSPQDYEFYTIDTEEEINRISLDARGGAVSIQFTFEKLTARSGGNNDGATGAVIIRIKRGATTLRTIRMEGHMVAHTITTGFGENARVETRYYKQLNYDFVTLATLIDTPPQGEQVYTVTLESRGLNSGKSSADRATHPVIIKARSFQLLGVRR